MDTAERCRRSHLARWGIRTVQERFWEKVDKSGECWLWTGATRNGYGHFAMDGGPRYAHRLSWTLANPYQAIPKGMEICHSCDVKLCVNPAHLWLGTRLDNARDMKIKGRGRGSHVGRPQTYCKRGHLLAETRRNGRCHVCATEREAQWHRDKRARERAARAT